MPEIPSSPEVKPLPPAPIVPATAAPGTLTAKTTSRPEFSKARQRWVGFFWWILMPLDCVDLRTGLPDHDRLVSLAVGAGLGFKIMTEKGYPPLGITALAVSAMFGVRVFKLFLVRSQFKVKDEQVTQNVHVVQEIVQRRTLGDGTFEPT